MANAYDRKGESGTPGLHPHWCRRPHDGFYINSTAISGDGGKIVAGTFFHSYGRGVKTGLTENRRFGTYCYSRSGDLLWKHEFDGWEGVYWVAISDDGNVAASGGWQRGGADYQGFIRAFDADDESGKRILDYTTGSRTNAVALSGNGSTLVAAGDQLHVFALGEAIVSRKPDSFGGDLDVTFETISISRDGHWAVAGDSNGGVYLLEIDVELGKWQHSHRWSLPGVSTVHSAQMSADGEWFVVGGADGDIYAFQRTDLIAECGYQWSHQLTTRGAVYGVAISETGDRITAIGNDGDAGAVSLIHNNAGSGLTKWTQNTVRNPNSTSMDSSATYVTVADGHPDGTKGHYYVFDGESGQLLGTYTTSDMSWPMFISADGSVISAGSDNSTVYCFLTPIE